MNRVDLARFEFDYDTTWHGFFLDADLNIYSRYGGRDEASADGRQSKESLLTTMGEVLEVHQRRQARADRRTSSQDNDRRSVRSAPTEIPSPTRGGGEHLQRGRLDFGFHPPPGNGTTPADIPCLKRAHQGCVHCHQVREFRLLQDFHDGKFQREQLFVYPLPENIGLNFDRDHGHRIKEVLPDSPAAMAGLAVGDIV